MNKELAKETYGRRIQLDSDTRVFRYNEEIEMTFARKFRYTDADSKLLAFANDETGIISDCYIMYAIAHLGVCDQGTISLFLEALQKKAPTLNIISNKNKDGIRERMRLLFRRGYLFNIKYSIDAKTSFDGEDETSSNTVSLFTITESAYDMVKQHLQKRLSVNSFIQAKPISEMIGWASAARVGAMIANNSRFQEYLERVLRTKQLGSVYLPCELKVAGKDVSYYIAVVSAFLYYNDRYQTPGDFNEYCAFKINTIKNYFACRTTKGQAVVVCAVADNADLVQIADMIHRAGILNPYLDFLYFTGEGLMHGERDFASRFLQMRLATDDGYEIVAADPVFLD